MLRLGRWAVGLLFLSMLVVPTTLQAERGTLLTLIFLGSFIVFRMSQNGWVVGPPIVFWLIVCVAYSLFSIVWGVLNDAPGAITVSTVYVFWPILYVYFIGFAKGIGSYVFLIKILLIGIFFAAMSGVLFVASSFYPALNIINPFFDLLSGSLGLYENSTEFALNNMTTVIYGLPFLISMLMLGAKTSTHFSQKWKVFLVANLLISFFVMLISGRKAFMIVGLISLPMSLVLMYMTRIAIVKIKSVVKSFGVSAIVVIFGIFVASITLDLDISVLLENFILGFDFDDPDNISAARRAEQFNALIGEWQGSAFIGFGHGSASHSAPGDVMPWAYELQYVALLFQTGILGMLIYGSAVFWLIYQMIRLSRNDSDLAVLMLPALVALICFLMANATNPYLSKFDYLWTLFLPVGLVNVGFLRGNPMRSSSTGLHAHA